MVTMFCCKTLKDFECFAPLAVFETIMELLVIVLIAAASKA